MSLRGLHGKFPKEAVSWRIQGKHFKDARGTWKGRALAYIDARDVMERLDEICGFDKWQDEYVETAKGRVLCRIGIRIGDDWIWKSDGAGDTDVEGEKGAISDAFKRAAVKWGVGRYLYDMPAPWVPCEVDEKNGNIYFKKWREDPWSYVHNKKPIDLSPEKERHAVINRIRGLVNVDDLRECYRDLPDDLKADADIMAEFHSRKAELEASVAHGVA